MQAQPINTFYANHKKEPAILLGNGPSLELLRPYQGQLEGFCQIGMNKSWKLWPTLHHCIMFHYEHLEDLVARAWNPRGTFLWAYKNHCEKYLDKVQEGNVIYVDDSVFRAQGDLKDTQIFGLISIQLDEGSSADMTGHFALEVALWMKCNPIYLIGYDLYGEHFDSDISPDRLDQEIQTDMFDETAKQLKLDMPEVEIYNLSPDSTIQGFEKKTLEEVFDVPSQD